MKPFLIFLTLSTATFAQNDSLQATMDSVRIREVVDQLFRGMQEGDSAMVSAVFGDDVRMYTTFTTKEGENRLMEGSLEEFLQAIGTPHEEVWDERISNVVIQVDGNLAQVWMDYSFYVDENFSHCGVNAIQMVKLEDWKMVHLIDTRRRADCH